MMHRLFSFSAAARRASNANGEHKRGLDLLATAARLALPAAAWLALTLCAFGLQS
jgi:hypothetical protein